ncbi:helix-turn-helix domain-containing protein [Novosphingobium pituita]|uniref:HTH cro/C1-type domain-containing protein n=1 Tax=Novosphingobium pituita TaxID=3056842 RepID=A0ABQ6P5G3_9SPHN|nr:helix-turn-helix transcriptional regulator [Novosphingobium sp. IK01]MDK4805209.1 helix-turn-helix transcriptional regulator [Novosphingobium aromaticivorans]GMM60503.1 hypothetical protein NUTIK01_12800 [Novosphingobium sp. IK01]HIQ16435.1 XRE family transcriptional regulator [Novosphingobium capsulatum]
MINRIREIRRQKGLTLADVAARCQPPTTAQTIGRLETGTRSLSLKWMNRIGAALAIDPELLVRAADDTQAEVIARLTPAGTEPIATPVPAPLPDALYGHEGLVALSVEASAGDWRAGDQIWLRRFDGEEIGRALNRDVLAPRPGGRFAFGRMIDHREGRLALLPPGPGQRQLVIDRPAWVAVAEVLIRTL